MSTMNGAVNQTVAVERGLPTKYQRWFNAPTAIDVPVQEIGEEVEVNLQDLDDPTELCQLLENERAEQKYWITVALAYAQKSQLDHALDVLQQALRSLSRGPSKDRLNLLICRSWIYLLKSRTAPRVVGEGQDVDTKTREYYLREATQEINDAMRVNPSHPPIHLLRGALSLLRASLATSTRAGLVAENERNDALNQATRNFEDAIKSSNGRNLLALMGKARALYMQRRYQPAMQTYQQVLSKNPQFRDPDPRIGIGACMWQLGYHENARTAWERALALNESSNIAHTLLGIYYLRESGKLSSDHPDFLRLYEKAVKEHLRHAYQLDKQQPLSSAAFSTYFLNTKRFDVMEPLAKRAIEQTDVNTIASDGWFTRARKEHELKNFSQASDAYNRADAARGGQNAGYLPAKFGMIQLLVESGEMQTAKFQLEKLYERQKAVEIMTLLGCLYAEEVFAALRNNPKEDKSADIRKATRILELVRKNWSDDKAKVKSRPDPTVLLYLARLYESENPYESEKCLAEVENLQRRVIADENDFDATSEDFTDLIQEQMPPQLHNNIGCFCYNEEVFAEALRRFEIALNATLKLHEKQTEERKQAEENGGEISGVDVIDTDALVTTISYNLARTQEALGQLDDAVRTYEGLLARHGDYTDATARLAYITLRTSPQDQGPKNMKAMYTNDYGNPEVRSLMGWYYHLSKPKTANIGEDQEYRHYKHTLQNFDKHDMYSLIGMGNIHLTLARDMPRNSDSEKEKRSKMYQKAYEFFDKALQLDPQNAYAAQGVAIALCDDKKQYSDALQILVKIKDTIRDASVSQNLGHIYCELKQYQRSIDNYENALKKQIENRNAKLKAVNGEANGHANGVLDHKEDAQLLACLSRVWLMKSKNDRSILSMNTSLELMRRSLATQPDSPHLRFNVAFIQFNMVQLITSLSDSERTLEDVQAAKVGLEDAVATFEDVAHAKNPPYPRNALEQRAAMSKGSMMKQIDRALSHQAEYERQNAEKLAEAKKKREEEIRAREAAITRRHAEEQAREDEVAKKRAEMIAEAERQAEKFRAEAMAREMAEYTTDEEGQRVKRQKKKRGLPTGEDGRKGRKRKQRADDEDGFIEHDEDADSDGSHGGRIKSRTPLSGSEEERPKKKKKLERGSKQARKKEPQGKYKSAAVVVDSDESEEEAIATPKSDAYDSDVERAAARTPGSANEDVSMQASDNEEISAAAPKRQRKQLRTIADDDDDDGDDNNEDEALPTIALRAAATIEDEEDE